LKAISHHQLNKLIEEAVRLVRPIAQNIARNSPIHLELADLIGAGQLGLMNAAATYDPSREVPWDWWAKMKIRGAILDSLKAPAPAQLDDADKPDERPTPEDLAAESSDVARIRTAIEQLPHAEREIIRLRFYEGASIATAATRLARSRTSTVTLRRRALASLRQSVVSRSP
jgi:RNA polymerase sigma factor for flagellar operon FliA